MMMVGGFAELLFGPKAERQALETIARPPTAGGAADDHVRARSGADRTVAAGAAP
jgi:hypothetical protein